MKDGDTGELAGVGRGFQTSSDFNPIEKAFSWLKAMLRKAGERTVSGPWNLIGRLVEIFQPDESANYFKSCGYKPD